MNCMCFPAQRNDFCRNELFFYSVIKDAKCSRARMGSDAGADIIDDDIVNAGQFFHIRSGKLGILHAVAMHNAYRDGKNDRILRGMGEYYKEDYQRMQYDRLFDGGAAAALYQG